MTTVEALEQAVQNLAPKDLARFREWFVRFDADAWDARIDSDAESGRLDALAAEAFAEYQSGQVREL